LLRYAGAMRGSEWEFRYRFWIILGIYVVAYACYAIDARNLGFWLAARWNVFRGGMPRPSPEVARGIFLAAAALAVLGAWLRTWAAAYLHTEVVHDERRHDDRVVADGPYRHLRNPLYLGMLLAGVSMAPMMSRVGGVVLVVFMVVFSLRLIGGEEALLTASRGESYLRFRDAVPSLLPALRPRLPASGTPPRWGQAILGEAFFYSFPLALAVFALTFNARWFGWVLTIALLLRGVLANLWWRRRAEPVT